MDSIRFERTYRALAGISDSAADIYGSEAGRKTAGMELPCLALRRMQLEQSRVFRRENNPPEGPGQFSPLVHRTVCQMVREQLDRFQGAERQGALLVWLDRLAGLTDTRWTPEERAAAARLPEERLVTLTASGVERCAKELCGQSAVPAGAGTEAWEAFTASGNVQAEAAALAIAAWAECPELRWSPELLASVSAAAASIEKRQSAQELVEPVAYALILTAAVLLVAYLTASLLTAAAMAAVDAAEAGAAFGWAAITKHFTAILELFSTELKVFTGSAAAGLTAKAAAWLMDYVPVRVELSELRQETEEAAGEEAFEDEEADEHADKYVDEDENL